MEDVVCAVACKHMKNEPAGRVWRRAEVIKFTAGWESARPYDPNGFWRGCGGEWGEADKVVWAKMGEICCEESRDLELIFSINLFFHSSIILPIYGPSETSSPQLWAEAGQSFAIGFFP